MIIQSCTVLLQFSNKCTVHELVHRIWVSMIWAVKPLQTPAGIGCFPYMKLDTYMQSRLIPVTSYKHFSCSTSICLWNFGVTIPIYIHCTCTHKVLNLPRSFRSEILFLARSRCSSPIQSLKQLTSCKPREHIAFCYQYFYNYTFCHLYFLAIHNYIVPHVYTTVY